MVQTGLIPIENQCGQSNIKLVNYGLLRSWLPQRLPWTSPPWSIQDETTKWSWNLGRYMSYIYSPKVDNYGWTSISNGAFASDVGTHSPYACMGYTKVACVIHTSHIYGVLNHQLSSTDSWPTEALSLQIWSPSSADPSEAAGIRLPPWFSTGSSGLLPLKDVPVPGIRWPLGRCQDGWSSWIHLGQQKPQDSKGMDEGVWGIELRGAVFLRAAIPQKKSYVASRFWYRFDPDAGKPGYHTCVTLKKTRSRRNPMESP